MRVDIRCEVCGCGHDVKYFCDTCGIDMAWEASITLINGDAEYHFCNYKCSLAFVLNEINKLIPQDKLFGEETQHGE